MQLQTCRYCKKFFNAIYTETLCPNCSKELDNLYKEVKEFVQDNKGSTIVDVVKYFNHPLITERQLKRWIKEDRLQFEGEYTGLFCRTCGKTIISGEICDDCRAALIAKMESTIKRPEKKQNIEYISKREQPRMRFIQN